VRLFYDDLNKKIKEDMNFKQNQYDPCVYNKRVGENMITICIHVEDLKVSCKSKELLEEVVEQLRNAYGEITVHYGDEHDYLGMVLSYNPQQKTVTLNMKKYIEDMMGQFEQENADEIKIVKTPANNNLFQTRKTTESMMLSKHQSMQFHSNGAKMLFLAKRGRPDILLADSFLTTRVKALNTDDRKKLLRVLGYLKGTIDLDLTITCKDLSVLNWYIDGSYAVHEEMKGHSGSVLMIGDNVVLSRSNKQKINTGSSAEAELIAVDDTLPTVQWTRLFMKDQGYDLETVMKEDNKSTMLLMKNGRLSSGKRTKHLETFVTFMFKT